MLKRLMVYFHVYIGYTVHQGALLAMDRSLYSLRGVLDNILLNRDRPAATVSLVPSVHFSCVSMATADGEAAHIHSLSIYQYVTQQIYRKERERERD